MKHYNEWQFFFEDNQQNFNSVRWSSLPELTSTEKSLVSAAIQQFQHGENSEGNHLKRHAKAFNHDYFLSIQSFIKEEQRHSAVLLKFMQQENIPTINGHWIDFVFRKIRNLGNIEISILVLSSAEIMATTFYKALQKSTRSQTLRDICSQILIDEESHINYQAFTLNKLNTDRGYLRFKFFRYMHTLFVIATALVVWLQYRTVYKNGGYSFFTFMNETIKEYMRMESMMAYYRVMETKTQNFSIAPRPNRA